MALRLHLINGKKSDVLFPGIQKCRFPVFPDVKKSRIRPEFLKIVKNGGSNVNQAFLIL